jgi:TonB family protein
MLAFAFVVTTSAVAVVAQEPVYQPGNGVTDPVLTHEVKPNYTADAMRRKIQGDVELSAVVLKDGTVGDTHVTRTLDPDLDREAEKAAKQWRFKPATKNGEPVNVSVTIQMTFRLREDPIYRPPFGGVTAPKAVKTVDPEYEDSARQERIQGIVELEGVAEPDGTVTGIHVVKSLDERLDRQAMKALTEWRFTPAQKDGKAVRAFVRVEMSFSLK